MVLFAVQKLQVENDDKCADTVTPCAFRKMRNDHINEDDDGVTCCNEQ